MEELNTTAFSPADASSSSSSIAKNFFNCNIQAGLAMASTQKYTILYF